MGEEGLKAKVGALVVVAVMLLVGFVVALGTFTVGEQRTLYLELNDSGSMLRGAPVKIAGVRAGRVEAVEFLVDRNARRSRPRHQGEARVNVRVTVSIREDMAGAVREDSEFYITTQGVLGEKYLEILPGSDGSPEWAEGSYVRGHDPARMDLLFAKADAILGQVQAFLSGGREVDIGALLDALTRLTQKLDGFVGRNDEALDRIVANIDGTLADAREIAASARKGVGDGEDLRAMIVGARSLAERMSREAGPLSEQAKQTLGSADATMADLRGFLAANRAPLDAAIADLPTITGRAKDVSRDAAAITAALTEGRGTVGQLLTDRELYDDLKEMLRDLKRHPWKMLWKE